MHAFILLTFQTNVVSFPFFLLRSLRPLSLSLELFSSPFFFLFRLLSLRLASLLLTDDGVLFGIRLFTGGCHLNCTSKSIVVRVYECKVHAIFGKMKFMKLQCKQATVDDVLSNSKTLRIVENKHAKPHVVRRKSSLHFQNAIHFGPVVWW